MNIIIRPAIEADIADLIVLMQDHAAYEQAEFDSCDLAPKLKRAMQGNSPRLIFFVAEVDQENVGYCSLTLEFSSWRASEYLHMDCLYIDNEMRGRRLGKMLFDKALSYAKKLGVGELQWQTPEWNEGAIRFYLDVGAEDSAKRRFRYRVA